MSINPADLSPAELEIYVAGYRDAIEERKSLYARLEEEAGDALTEIAQLTAQLVQANADADRYYAIAFNPRPIVPDGPTRAELEQIRAEMYNQPQPTTNVSWDTTTEPPHPHPGKSDP